MKIRRRLTWMLVALATTSIMVVISFSILYIRDFLRQEGRREMKRQGQVIAEALRRDSAGTSDSPPPRWEEQLDVLSAVSGLDLLVADLAGGGRWGSSNSLAVSDAWRDYLQREGPSGTFLPDSLCRGGALHVFALRMSWAEADPRGAPAQAPARWLLLAQPDGQMLSALTDIRWILYNAMFITAGLVALLIALFSRQLARPILRVRDIAQKLAHRQWEAVQEVHRRDEIGSIARSLNQMAQELQAENQRLQTSYARQRQFYADITHELSNPLHTMMGALEMLEMPELPEGHRKRLAHTAHRQGQRLSKMFADLKSHQQYEEAPDFVRARPTDLGAIARAVGLAYGAMARAQGIGLEVKEDARWVRADPERIQAALENLVSNGLKYTPEGGSVRLRYFLEGTRVRVEVVDTGIGIPEEHQPKIFDRFYRTEKARSRDQGGTGLGLSVVKIILQAHGQDIHLKSRPGKGSTFYFYLPPASPSETKTEKSKSTGSETPD
jgi:signal transduction histidine kinase